MSVDLLQNSRRPVLNDLVLQHHDVARLSHRKVRFSSHDQAEGLKRCGHRNVVLRSRGQHLSQVVRAAVRSDRPQDVGQVFATKPICWSKPFKSSIDVDSTALAGDLSFALGHGKKWCSLEGDFRRTTAMQIVHCVQIALNHLLAL